MIKLMGSIMTAGAAAYLGFYTAARLRRQVRVLGELEDGLMILEQELELSSRELDELMYRASRHTKGAAKKLFSDYGKNLERLGEKTAEQLWEQAVCGIEDLTREAAQCMGLLGGIMGQYESGQQRSAVAAVRARMENLRKKEEKLCRTRCRTYQTVGLSGGAFLVILLL